jgi:hypothetical protein
MLVMSMSDRGCASTSDAIDAKAPIQVIEAESDSLETHVRAAGGHG